MDFETMRISRLYTARNRGFSEYIYLTPLENKALDFIVGVMDWHTFDNTTRRAVLGLERKGLVEVSHSTSQFRLARKYCD